MSREDSIELEGTVVDVYPSGMFKIEITSEHSVLAHLAGRLRRNKIRVLNGDRVTIEVSPYDLSKGRITFRHR